MARTIMQLTSKIYTVKEVDAQFNKMDNLRHSDKDGNHEDEHLVKRQQAFLVLRKAVIHNSTLKYHKYFCDILCDVCVAMDELLSSCTRCCNTKVKSGHTCGVFGHKSRSGSWQENKYTYVFRNVAHGMSLDAAVSAFKNYSCKEREQLPIDPPVTAVISRTTARNIMKLTGETLTVQLVENKFKQLQNVMHPRFGGNITEFVKLRLAYLLLRKAVAHNSTLNFQRHFCDLLCDECVAMDGLLSSCNRCCKTNHRCGHTCGVFGNAVTDVKPGSWVKEKYTHVFRNVAHGMKVDDAVHEYKIHQTRHNTVLQVVASEMRHQRQTCLRSKFLKLHEELLDDRERSGTNAPTRFLTDSSATVALTDVVAGASSSQYGPLKTKLRRQIPSPAASTHPTTVRSHVSALRLSQAQAGLPSDCPLCKSGYGVAHGPYGRFLGCVSFSRASRCK